MKYFFFVKCQRCRFAPFSKVLWQFGHLLIFQILANFPDITDCGEAKICCNKKTLKPPPPCRRVRGNKCVPRDNCFDKAYGKDYSDYSCDNTNEVCCSNTKPKIEEPETKCEGDFQCRPFQECGLRIQTLDGVLNVLDSGTVKMDTKRNTICPNTDKFCCIAREEVCKMSKQD